MRAACGGAGCRAAEGGAARGVWLRSRCRPEAGGAGLCATGAQACQGSVLGVVVGGGGGGRRDKERLGRRERWVAMLVALWLVVACLGKQGLCGVRIRGRKERWRRRMVTGFFVLGEEAAPCGRGSKGASLHLAAGSLCTDELLLGCEVW